MRKNLTIKLKNAFLLTLTIALSGLLSSCAKRTYSAMQSQPVNSEHLTLTGSPYSPFVEKIPEDQPALLNTSSMNEEAAHLSATEAFKKLPLGKRLLLKTLQNKLAHSTPGTTDKNILQSITGKVSSAVKLPLLANASKQHPNFSLEGSLRSGLVLLLLALVLSILAAVFAVAEPLGLIFWIAAVIIGVIGVIEILLWLINQA